MIIIEAGGSSTQVCQILHGAAGEIRTYKGISPIYMQEQDITAVLEQILKGQKTDNELMFYGTGCRQSSAKQIIERCINSIKKLDRLEIASDLLAAARAVAKNNVGQINILGTGAASCLYDQEKIKEVYFNSGYLFGDYGSGFQMGQEFLRAYFENRLSAELETEIQQFAGLTKQELVKKIYGTQSPKQYVASFTKCIHKIKHNTEVAKIINDSFSSFIRFQIQLNPDFKNSPQYFVGSIAYFFEEELSKAMDTFGLNIADICRAPIEKLIGYHLT